MVAAEVVREIEVFLTGLQIVIVVSAVVAVAWVLRVVKEVGRE